MYYQSMKQFHETLNRFSSPSSHKATLRDVARAVGVSPGTVSRAFTNSARVAPELKERIMTAAKTLGYRPAATAVGNRIAVLVGCLENLTGHYDGALFSALSLRIVKHGYGVEIEDSRHSDLSFEHFVKAAVAISYLPSTKTKLRAISQVPLLTVNNVMPGISSVCVDHAQGARMAVERLRSRGCRRIAMLTTAASDNWGGRERFQGYCEAVPESERLFRAFAWDDVFENVAWAVRAGADALIAAGEGLALPVCHVLDSLGKKIPDDISIISYEVPRQSRYLSPPHSAIDQNLEGLADKVVELLLDMIDTPPATPFRVTLDNRFIERESVRKP